MKIAFMYKIKMNALYVHCANCSREQRCKKLMKVSINM